MSIKTSIFVAFALALMTSVLALPQGGPRAEELERRVFGLDSLRAFQQNHSNKPSTRTRE